MTGCYLVATYRDRLSKAESSIFIRRFIPRSLALGWLGHAAGRWSFPRQFPTRGRFKGVVAASLVPALVAPSLPPHHQRGVLGPIHPHTPQRMVSR